MMENDNSAPAQALPSSSASLAPVMGATLVLLMIAAIGSYAVRAISACRDNSDCYEQEITQDNQAPRDYTQWDKPLVAIVLSGQMHGQYDPCGCSVPQYGGLTRRFNFVQALKAKKWDVVGIDLGELPSLNGIPKQNLLKYEMSIRALGAMNYRAIGIGRDEILSPLGEALAQIEDSRKPFPRTHDRIPSFLSPC